MTTYEILDIIADSYNPVLFFFSVYYLITCLLTSRLEGIIKLLLFSTLISTIYILQAIDNTTGLWASFQSDYSTHTAFALAITFFFVASHQKLAITIAFTFIACLCLMLYQQYHTLLDISSTIIIISPIMLLAVSITKLKLAKLNI